MASYKAPRMEETARNDQERDKPQPAPQKPAVQRKPPVDLEHAPLAFSDWACI